MGNNPVMGVDPDGRIWHIVIGAVIGGVVNLGVKAFQGKINSWGDGFAAFGIGAAGGALTAATGGAIAASAGLSVSTVAGGVVAGASGAAFGSPVQGIGNAMYFGDAYGGGQFLTDVIAGGLLGGVAGGVAGWLKNIKNVRNGGQPGDIWGFKAGVKRNIITFNYPEPIGAWGRDGQPLKEFAGHKFGGMEYLDEGVRSTPQPFAGAARGGVDAIEDLIKLNGGRNSVTIETATQKIRYDLAGKPHGGVPTPHKQVYIKNFVNGIQKSVSRVSKAAFPMTEQDLELVRRFLNGQ